MKGWIPCPKATAACRLFAALLLVGLVLPGRAAADILPVAVCYVNAGVVGGENSGLTWADAYNNLQDALGEPACGEIWVAAGIYKPGTIDTDWFLIPPGVAVYGGFDGTESSRDQRDWVAHVTILSGDLAGDDIDPNADQVIADGNDIRNVNSHHVVVVSGGSSGTTVLDGFTITAGDAHDTIGGAGLLCSGSGAGNICNPTLENLVFSGNRAMYHAGGAIFNNGESGGNSSPQLYNVRFTGNRGQSGGAMYNDGAWDGLSMPVLRNVTFTNNIVSISGGAIYNYAWLGYTSPILNNVVFSHNSAGQDGGAIYNGGSNGVSNPQYTQVTFNNNSAQNGGAVYNDGIGSGNSSPSFANVTFSLNTASMDGGAVYNDGEGGMSSPAFTNVTFSGNSAISKGGAMANDVAGTLGGETNPVLTNVILWGNTALDEGPQVWDSVGAFPNISYSVVQGGCASIAGAFCLGINFSTNPLLLSLANNGGYTQTMALQEGSSAIDAGSASACAGTPVNGMDQRDHVRTLDGDGNGTFICDIGAYEYLPDEVFWDVPVTGKEWMKPWIHAFYEHGITTGCSVSPLGYCPENNVTRAEMSVFLLRANHRIGYAPPALEHFFADMPVAGKEWMEPWVDEFYREGMTTGCALDPLRYCPEQNVTRAEMAVFVLRATHLPGWTPPPASGVFYDVPVPGKEWMEPWIIEFYNEGITTGCGVAPLRYCPENNTTRAEMAVFIDRAFHLYP